MADENVGRALVVTPQLTINPYAVRGVRLNSDGSIVLEMFGADGFVFAGPTAAAIIASLEPICATLVNYMVNTMQYVIFLHHDDLGYSEIIYPSVHGQNITRLHAPEDIAALKAWEAAHPFNTVYVVNFE